MEKGNRMYIETTGQIIEGTCNIQRAHCKANPKGVITIVISPNESNKEIHVCNVCLHELLQERLWTIKGALVPEMKKFVDLAVVDQENNIIIAFEVKNWKETGVEKGESWAKRMYEMAMERMQNLNTRIFVLVTFEGFYIFKEKLSEPIFVNFESEIHSFIQKIQPNREIFIEDKREFTTQPALVDQKHTMLIDIVEQFIMAQNTLDKLPQDICAILKKNTIQKNFTL